MVYKSDSKYDPSCSRVWTTSSDFNNMETLTQNDSTIKLIQTRKDEQTRCSIIHYTIFCLNLNYANLVRFPRELERHGLAFLVPYIFFLSIIGIPVVLLEMSLGQFLGQSSAHIWKISPFFKGAAVMGRLGGFIECLWISMHSSLVLLYIGQLFFSSVPFPQCPSTVFRNVIELGYEEKPTTGQICLENSFLRSIYDSPQSFGALAIGVCSVWFIIMVATTSKRIIMKSVIFFGTSTLALLLFQTTWQLTNTISHKFAWPQLWPFNFSLLKQSGPWFNALVQVILSTQIGTGSVGVVTGKLLHKGDVMRMSSLYICFNFLISIVATAYFMTTFGQNNNSATVMKQPFPDLSAITSIYDRAFEESDKWRHLIPILSYLMILFSCLISLSITMYTLSSFFRQKLRSTMCIVPMVISILCLIYPKFYLAQLLDFYWTGVFLICSLTLEHIGTTWVYGTNSISIDLEFSIGRPIKKCWLFLWTSVPIFLISFFTFYLTTSTFDFHENWLPFLICAILFIYFAIYETTKQIDYNTCNKIREATLPSKDWGPADPIVRHAWKNWKTVCNGGYRDFTLRRRGTKDWTSSIKKGQYSHTKYGMSENKYPLALNRASNCSDSLFGDSAIEEDIGYDKLTTSKNFDGQSFLNSYQSIPIRISNPSKQTLNLQRIPLEKRDNSDIYWSQQVSVQRQFNRQNFNCTIMKNYDEFSTEL